jgi:hypothetical protein
MYMTQGKAAKYTDLQLLEKGCLGSDAKNAYMS